MIFDWFIQTESEKDKDTRESEGNDENKEDNTKSADSPANHEKDNGKSDEKLKSPNAKDKVKPKMTPYG